MLTVDLSRGSSLNDLFLHWLSLQSTEHLIKDSVKAIRFQSPNDANANAHAVNDTHSHTGIDDSMTVDHEPLVISITNTHADTSTKTDGQSSPTRINLRVDTAISTITDGTIKQSPPSSPSPESLSHSPAKKRKSNSPVSVLSPAGRSPRVSQSQAESAVPLVAHVPLIATDTARTIKQFYFPQGQVTNTEAAERELEAVHRIFTRADSDASSDSDFISLTRDEFFPLTQQVCGLSSYCNTALFNAVLEFAQTTFVPANTQTKRRRSMKSDETADTAIDTHTNSFLLDVTDSAVRVYEDEFIAYFLRYLQGFDTTTRFFHILRQLPAHRYLIRDSFKPVIADIVARHPGLEFLEATPEFQLKYAQTVIARIFYTVNVSGNERLTLWELKNSNFLLMLNLLDNEDDINKLNDYFSYEHFYVIYCKFWELDSDHDGLIDRNDLQGYEDFALTSKIVDRIVNGAGRPLLSQTPGKLNYLDFVIFLMSEVDKNSRVSIDYWFNCLDLDCDNLINAYEMNYFFEEQKLRIQALSQEQIHFSDIFCQLMDMIQNQGNNDSASFVRFHGHLSANLQLLEHSMRLRPTFTRKDFHGSTLSGSLFNTLFNLQKFILSEQRDPLRIKQIHDTPQLSDWDRYAISGYYRLAEGENEAEEEPQETDSEEEAGAQAQMHVHSHGHGGQSWTNDNDCETDVDHDNDTESENNRRMSMAMELEDA